MYSANTSQPTHKVFQ